MKCERYRQTDRQTQKSFIKLLQVAAKNLFIYMQGSFVPNFIEIGPLVKNFIFLGGGGSPEKKKFDVTFFRAILNYMRNFIDLPQ